MDSPMAVPGGRIARLMDPQGAAFALHQASKALGGRSGPHPSDPLAPGPSAAGPHPCTARPSSRMKESSASERGPLSTAARFSRSSATLRGPVSTTSTCGLVRQKR